MRQIIKGIKGLVTEYGGKQNFPDDRDESGCGAVDPWLGMSHVQGGDVVDVRAARVALCPQRFTP